MSEETKKTIKETVEMLKQLDQKSLALVNAGAKMLKMRADMDEEVKDEELEERN